MEPDQTNARAVFAAKLNALAAAPPGSESPAAKKRGFLTRGLFGPRNKPVEDQPDPAAEPAVEEPATTAVPMVPEPASVPAEAASALEIYPPAPSQIDRQAAGDLAEPRVSLPAPSSHQPSAAMVPAPLASTAAGRASTQLTLAFEVTALQLTPFFRLGSAQLRALSDVVSLALVADGQADQPLAAGVAFGIERVELDQAARLKTLLLKPLGVARQTPAPVPSLQVDHVALTDELVGAPITVTTSGAASTAVQLIATFAIAAMEFSASFEVDSLWLEPAGRSVRLRIAPDASPTGQGLPSSFEIAAVQIGDDGQLRGARLVPTNP